MGVWLIGQGMACAGVSALAYRYRKRAPLSLAPAVYIGALYAFTNVIDTVAHGEAASLGWYSHFGYVYSFGADLFVIAFYLIGFVQAFGLWANNQPGNNWLGLLSVFYFLSACVNGDYLCQIAAIYPHFIDPSDRLGYWKAQTGLFIVKLFIVGSIPVGLGLRDVFLYLRPKLRWNARGASVGGAKAARIKP